MKHLLPQHGNLYKANLHCHTTCSDGRFTPEEIKAMYKEKGYSVVAFTDHGRAYPQSHLTDENFLALIGLEVGLGEYRKGDWRYNIRKNCDIGLISSDPEFRGTMGHEKYDGRYSPEVVNDIMRTYRNAGFFVTHNHPAWSLERYEDYKHYKYMHATEIVNYGSYAGGFSEHNEHVYDDMLMDGRRIFCLATDDNHNREGRPDSFGAYTMIKAEKLDYQSIMEALFAGNFYATEGPEIKELYVDDDKVLHVVTSPAVRISINTPTKMRGFINSFDGEPVTELSWQLQSKCNYIRVVVTDEHGKNAYSNAYFLDDILL